MRKLVIIALITIFPFLITTDVAAQDNDLREQWEQDVDELKQENEEKTEKMLEEHEEKKEEMEENYSNSFDEKGEEFIDGFLEKQEDFQESFLESQNNKLNDLNTLLIVFLVSFCIFYIPVLIFTILMFIDCLNRDFKDRTIWIIILLLGLLGYLGVIAPLLYYFMVKRKNK